ncbi:hypothetical protein Trydic_g3144 [Trypoxylus dichotomus]
MVHMESDILLMLSDEAIVHISGRVNKHNCVTWATEQPKEVREYMQDSPRPLRDKIIEQVYGGERTTCHFPVRVFPASRLTCSLQPDGSGLPEGEVQLAMD